jgi:hypothetical protein
MRRLRRPNITPPTLRHSGAGGKREKQHLDDRKVDPDTPLSFPDYWNLPDVRGALYAFHGRACGYCARHLPGNDRGDVDHFRPKGNVVEDPTHGGYWWLAYTFASYVLSCSVCNRTLKRDHFPLIRPGARHYRFAQRSRLSREARAPLDPVLDQLENWVRANWRDSLCPVEPRPCIPEVAKRRVDWAVDFFRLNIDPDLVRARLNVIEAVQEALHEGDGDKASLLAVRFSPHSFVAREMLADVAPEHLPTPQVELKWVLRALLDELDLTLSLNERTPHDFPKLRIQELLWALAAIWLDPPAGKSADLDAVFAKEQVDRLILPLRNELAAADGS